MGNNVYKVLGTIFMLMSGIFYTAERIIESGYASHGVGSDRTAHYPQFFDNFFVWFFLLIGFVLLVYGFPKEKD
jgi:TRAP-type mannitol/chloroaromatic compound transport system permease small subunit